MKISNFQLIILLFFATALIGFMAYCGFFIKDMNVGPVKVSFQEKIQKAELEKRQAELEKNLKALE